MKRLLLLVSIGLALAACSTAPVLTRPTEEPPPTTTPDRERGLIPTIEPSETPLPTLTLFPTGTPDDPDWEDRTPGVERREIIVVEPHTATQVRLHMVRLDPTLVDFTVHYEPGTANSVSGWQSETGAMVIVNGGFFDGEFYTDGITVIDGEEHGVSPSYEEKIGVGGFFAVKDGEVSIVPLDREPVEPGTVDFDFATQSYPMLLMPGGEPAFDEETGHAAQRTVVGIDDRGRVVFIVIRTGVFTLYELSRMLAELDEEGLYLDVALNLDGGKSSGMEVRAGREHTHWESEASLPIIIAAYPKEGVPVVPTASFGLRNE